MAIKTLCEDFVVIEQIDPAWLDAVVGTFAPFAVYRLDKRDMTTPDACDAVARALHVPPQLVAAAGLKDRQAVTTQHITVGPLRPTSGGAAMPRHLQSDTWRIARLGFCEKQINASAIAANRFELVLRTLTPKAIDDMNAAADRIRAPGSNTPALRFVNYFGSQRFGSARHREGFAAHCLCKGDFAEALRLLVAAPHKNDTRNVKLFKRIVRDKWGRAGGWRDVLSVLPTVPERRVIEYMADHPDDYAGGFRTLPYFTQQMCVEAYQSWLWNRIARELIVQWCPTHATFTVPDTFNDLTFPIPGALPATLDKRLLDMNLPVLGRDSELTGPWAPAAGKILNEENLTTTELTIPGVEKPAFNQVHRKLIVDAADWRIDDPAPDELQTKARRFKRKISFTLPRGSYATIALRAIGN
ncbi:MAG: tRNA pseudouridine(13) synthase TruD [Phycisphaerales bacterium]